MRDQQLLGQLLRNELERSEPDVAAGLDARAMEWCIANDMAEAAIVFGHAAGETETVAGLVDSLALPVYLDGRRETLEEWIGWFGADELAQYPALAIHGAWLRALTGRPDEAARWLALADGAASPRPSRPRRHRRGSHDPGQDRACPRAPPAPGLARRGAGRAPRPRGSVVRVGRRLGDEPVGR